MKDLLLYNLRQIVQIVDDATECLVGHDAMNNIKILSSDECSLGILCRNGKIHKVGQWKELKQEANSDVVQVDCKGGCVLPGFVDAHSHPVFGGDRVHEFAMKLAGATYMEVQAAGGGIYFTTERTKNASESDLLDDFKRIANEMIRSGTTLLEAKSGYGLEMETELKMLRVLESANKEVPLEISATFCGAHAVPRGSNEHRQAESICTQMLPKISEERKKGRLTNLENIDVFCEKNVFELETSKQILRAGQQIGLRANFHADELHPLGGAELAADIKATAASHLEEISENGIAKIAESGTVAVFLPSTAYILRLKPPPAREMISKGVCVALGSDFNPNAFCLSMPTIMHLACVLFKMSMPEALVSATLNAAHSLGRGKSHGAIATGRVADFVVIDAPKWEHVIYRFGCHQMIISHVVKSGSVVYTKGT
jgi:imidazolonepropionase